MAQVLELQFEVSSGRNLTISVDAPKPDLSVGQVYSVMQTIMQQDVFQVEGSGIIGLKGARIVERNVSNFDIPANV